MLFARIKFSRTQWSRAGPTHGNIKTYYTERGLCDMHKMRSKITNRALSWLLVTVMLMGMIPASAIPVGAVETDTEQTTATQSAADDVMTDYNDPDMPKGSLEDGTSVKAVTEWPEGVIVKTGDDLPDDTDDEEEEPAWDDGSLVLDLNMPDDDMWSLDESDGTKTVVGIKPNESQYLMGMYSAGDEADLSVLQDSLENLSFSLPVTYSDNTSGAVAIQATGLAYDRDGKEPVTGDTYTFDGPEAQTLYVTWDYAEVDAATLADTPSAQADDQRTSNLYTIFWDYGYLGAAVTSSTVGKVTGYVSQSVSWSMSGSVSSPIVEAYYVICNFSYPHSPERMGWNWLGWFNEDGPSVASDLLTGWYRTRTQVEGHIHLRRHYKGPTNSFYWSGANGYSFEPCDCDTKSFESVESITQGTTFTALWMACPIIWHSMGGEWSINNNAGGEGSSYEDQVKTGQAFNGDAGVTDQHYASSTGVGDNTLGNGGHERQYPGDPGLNKATCQTYVYNGFQTSEAEFVPIVVSPSRLGYTFMGWYHDPYCTVPINEYETGIQPRRHYYAGWQAEEVTIEYYDTREGTGPIATQTAYYHDTIQLLSGFNDTAGWNYVGWTTADGTMVADADGSLDLGMFQTGSGSQWCDFYMRKLAGGYAGTNGNGDRVGNDYTYYFAAKGDIYQGGGYEDTFDNEGRWVVKLYAKWEEETTPYRLKLVWNDYQNNDGARPTTVTVGLVDSYMNNEVIETRTVQVDPTADDQLITVFTDLPVQDNDASLQKRTYNLVFLGYTDAWGTEYTMQSPAIDGDRGDIDVQTVSIADNRTLTQYRYGVNNYGNSGNGANTGYEEGNYYTIITFDHALITTGDDIKFTIQWDDDGDNDGVRPGAVTLVLYADGVPVAERPWHNSQTGRDSVSAGLCEVTDDGNTWTYIFRDYQKYHEGKAIMYTVAIKNDDGVTTFDQNGKNTGY